MEVLSGHLFSEFKAEGFGDYRKRISELQSVYLDECDFLHAVVTDKELIQIVKKEPFKFVTEFEKISAINIKNNHAWIIKEDLEENRYVPETIFKSRLPSKLVFQGVIDSFE